MGFGVDQITALKRLSEYTRRPGWDSLTAVKYSNVHAVYHGGARTLYDYTCLQYIAKSLYPEAFADIDPLKNHRAYYEEYLPIKADGVFMFEIQ